MMALNTKLSGRSASYFGRVRNNSVCELLVGEASVAVTIRIASPETVIAAVC